MGAFYTPTNRRPYAKFQGELSILFCRSTALLLEPCTTTRGPRLLGITAGAAWSSLTMHVAITTWPNTPPTMLLLGVARDTEVLIIR